MKYSEWYEDALKIVLDVEGGYVFHKDDPGGATNRGISLRWLKSVGDLDGDGWLDGDLDHDGDVDEDDIKLITRLNAKELYYNYFWSKTYESIVAKDVAIKVFDMRVNMGKRQAHMLVQRACNYHGLNAMVIDDGAIGPNSLSAINNIELPLLPTIRACQAGFYRSLVMRNAALRKNGVKRPDGFEFADFSKFLKGWLWRARN